jgi:hypothetical protein
VGKLFTPRSHPSEDLLEEYALRRLNEEQSAPIEEHLLVCSACQEALAEIDDYVLVMKAETARMEKSSFRARLEGIRRIAVLTRSWRGIAWAAAAAACLMLVLYRPQGPQSPAVPVELISVREIGNNDKVGLAPAGKTLDLQIALGVASAASHRIDISEASGKPVWTGQAKPLDGKLHALVSQGLPKGLYWVRIFDSSELLAEFRLRTE